MVADRVSIFLLKSVLHKGGYSCVHCTVHQQEAAYIYNRITVRHGLYVRQHRADQGRHNPGWLGPLHLPQVFFWGQEGHKKKLKNTQQGETGRARTNTARN